MKMGLNQSDFGALIGFSASYINRLEGGTVEPGQQLGDMLAVMEQPDRLHDLVASYQRALENAVLLTIPANARRTISREAFEAAAKKVGKQHRNLFERLAKA
jgi:predicted transcriptional regulator